MKFFQKNTLLKRTINKTMILHIGILLYAFTSVAQDNNQSKEQWKKMESIVKAVKSPSFKNATYTIIQYGAQSNTKDDNSEAINKAILECSKNGGGKVVVPKGKYHSGPIHLEDNVNLHLDKDAEILFSTNPKDYYPLVHTSFEGTELMNYSPLVYAYQKKNVSITGGLGAMQNNMVGKKEILHRRILSIVCV
jgi:polygalacturonase